MIFRRVTLALSLALAPINPLLMAETPPTTQIEFTCIGDDNTALVARVIDITTQKVAISSTTGKARQSPPAIVFPTEYFRGGTDPQELCLIFARGLNKKVEENNGSLEDLYLTSGIADTLLIDRVLENVFSEEPEETGSGRKVICVVKSQEQLCISSKSEIVAVLKEEYRRFTPAIIEQIENLEAGVAASPTAVGFDLTYTSLEVMFGKYLELSQESRSRQTP